MIKIFGKIFNKQFQGKNISIANNKIFINGKQVDGLKDEKNITIEINGDIENIKADSCQEITIKGSCKGDIKTTSGDIKCKNIGGNVNTMSGNVSARKIAGSVSTMSGDVIR